MTKQRPATQAPTIRVSPQAHATIKALADAERLSMQDLTEKAVEHYRRAKLLDDMNASFAAMTDADRQEMQDLDGTAGDGLEDEPWTGDEAEHRAGGGR